MRLEWRKAAFGILGTVAFALFLDGCSAEPSTLPRVSTERVALVPLTPAPQVTGDPNRGRQLFVDARIVTPAGCASCHTIRGVPGATGIVGPNLTNVVLRPTLAGDTIPNNPANLVRWIMDPPGLKQGALMPNLGVSEQDARDLAAFLESQPYNPPSR